MKIDFQQFLFENKRPQYFCYLPTPCKDSLSATYTSIHLQQKSSAVDMDLNPDPATLKLVTFWNVWTFLCLLFIFSKSFSRHFSFSFHRVSSLQKVREKFSVKKTIIFSFVMKKPRFGSVYCQRCWILNWVCSFSILYLNPPLRTLSKS